jgi:hypothetical protein
MWSYRAWARHLRRVASTKQVALHLLLCLLVEVAAMGYPDHENFAGIVINLIAHAPISYADSPNAFFASHFETSRRSGVGSKRREGGNDAVLDRPVEPFQLALGP